MLELKNIHTHRGAVHVLNALSIAVSEREVVCLVGRNGAGKRQSLRRSWDTCRRNRARIILRDEDITRLLPHSGLGGQHRRCAGLYRHFHRPDRC